MQLKAKIFDFNLGSHEVFLTSQDAENYGLRALDRVKVLGPASVEGSAAVVKIANGLVDPGEAGLAKDHSVCYGLEEGETVTILAAARPRSVDFIRKKLDGKELSAAEMREVIHDIAKGELTDIELTAYATATYVHDMSLDETVACIEAMVESGETITFNRQPVLDVHSIGGVPGNKYAPIAVSIVAANGLLIPKTSSRAISSACGTADFMEVVTPVEFTASQIKSNAEKTGGALCWGGGVNLAPADDAIIRVEYPLSIDPHAQLLASVLAKKKAVGAGKVLIEIPTGAGAKVESEEKARKLARDFITVGEKIGIDVRCAITYGGQPIGRAIGPTLEIREAVQVLEGSQSPMSLIEKACSLAGILLEMGGAATKGAGYALAMETLRTGKALEKFREIIKAQGGDPDVSSDSLLPGKYHMDIITPSHGYVESLDNKKLVKIARAAGAPRDKGAGLYLHFKKGRRVGEGEALYTIYADHEYRLKDAVSLANHLKPLRLEGMILEEVLE